MGGWAQEEKEGRPKLPVGKGFGSAGGKFACSAPGVSGKAGSSWNCICVQAQIPVKHKEKLRVHSLLHRPKYRLPMEGAWVPFVLPSEKG